MRGQEFAGQRTTEVPVSHTAETQHRNRVLTSGMVTSVGARLVTMAVPAVLIPLTYRDFGPETYAVWSTVVATTSMFLWADLGLGNGLLTKLSAALAESDANEARQLISTAYSVLGLTSLFLVGTLAAILLMLPVESMLGFHDGSNVKATLAICFGLLFVNVPFALIQRVQYAAHEIASSNLIQATGPLFTLVGALSSVALALPPLVTIAVIALGPLLSSGLASSFFYRRHPELRPRFASAVNARARMLIRLGLGFLIIQFVSSVAMNVDPLLVSHLTSDAELADFTATMRIYLLIAALLTAVMLPLWPANVEAIVRGDSQWVRRITMRLALLGGVAAFAAGSVLLIMGRWLLPIVLGDRYEINNVLMLGFTLTWTVVGVMSPLFMVQNAAAILRPQFLGWPIYLLVVVAAKFFAGRALGIEWLPIAGALVYALVMVPTALAGYRNVLRDMKESRTG